MTVTAASGVIFFGLRALAYSVGISSLWQLLYPFGVNIGVWVSMVAIRAEARRLGRGQFLNTSATAIDQKP